MILEFDDQLDPGLSSVCNTLAAASAFHKARLDSEPVTPSRLGGGGDERAVRASLLGWY